MGGREDIPVDVRLIAATHRDLEQMMENGSFRPDLFYRLNVVSITIPPLKERPEDIPLLIDYFLHRHSQETGDSPPAIDPEAAELLADQQWPGNVRELENTVRQSILRARGYTISRDDVESVLAESAPSAASISASGPTLESVCSEALDQASAVSDSGDEEGDAYAEVIAKAERELLEQTMRRTGGNKAMASRLLGISRFTLREKLKRHGL